MNIARLSIKRPIFITCIVILLVVTGMIGLNRMGVDLFPPIDFPVLTVTTIYPGAIPEEIENLISKPLEEQISTISGLKRLSSRNMEGISIIIAEFTYESDIRYAEEKVREKVALARNNLPDDLYDEPLIKQFDFTELPVITVAVVADLPPTKLYDLTKERIKPLIEQVKGVGEVRISGGTRREIQVELDLDKLNAYDISAVTVANQLKNTGVNVPVGKFDKGEKSTTFRTIGQFTDIEQIKKSVVSFSGDLASAITLDKLATVRDGAEEVTTITHLYYPVDEGKKKEKAGFFSKKKLEPKKLEKRACLLIDVIKQSGSNSVDVADGVMKRMDKVNSVLKNSGGNPRLIYVYDTAEYIRLNVNDVKETMVIGIALAIIVVYLFLGNIRSTIITCIAIPNSLLGGFCIMYFMGFTINVMTLLAMSLAIGLLVDDAIVVRENIFRKLESGMHSFKAAEHGTTEVMLAVIATTLTIIAVFMPIGFMQGVVGRIFKQFGLSVVFAMSISLFDALTVAPFLSAYFSGTGEKAKNKVVVWFDGFQDKLELLYGKVIHYSLNHPLIIILVTGAVFFVSLGVGSRVKMTFQAESKQKEFILSLEMPPGTSINGTYAIATEIAEKIRKIPELNYMTVQIGNDQQEHNKASMGVFMVPREERTRDMDEIKEEVRGLLKPYAYAHPSIDAYSRMSMGGGNKPYMLNIFGEDLDVVNEYSQKVMAKLQQVPDLTEISSSYQPGKPEFQVQLDDRKMKMLGVSNKMAGGELRYHIEGGVVGKFHAEGLEYDVRMRLKPEQRNLEANFVNTKVPNMQFRMIPLPAIANGVKATGPAIILRQDRSRTIQIMANIAPGGAVGTALDRTRIILEKELGLPKGVGYGFIGQADAFEDMIKNIITALLLAILFIYLVLASLYESFITPFIILLALPPAISGAFFALFITGKMMDMNCMIGMIMLLGLVTKNSILLVDFALEGVRGGLTRKEAIAKAGMVRLRPILMTTFAMLAAMVPVALGWGEAAQYRTSMGITVIGGLIISTLITLIVVPAVFEYIDKLRERTERKFRPAPERKANGEVEEDVTREIAKDLARAGKKSGAAECVACEPDVDEMPVADSVVSVKPSGKSKAKGNNRNKKN